MKRLLAAAIVCALATPAGAQQPPSYTVKLSEPQWMLITNTLRAVGCQNVEQLIRCRKIEELLETIQAQALAQPLAQPK